MKRGVVLSLFLLMFSSYIYAGSELAGTTSTNFLKIPPFARPAAMGEAFIAVSDGTPGLYYNPAGICSVSGFEIQATHIEWFQGLRYEILSAVGPAPFIESGKIGFSFSWFQVDEMANTSDLPSYAYSDLQTTNFDNYVNGYFSPFDYSVILGYALDLRENFSSGLTLKYASQNIDTYSGSNISADLGFLYWLTLNNHFLKFGAVIANLGTDLRMSDLAFGTSKMAKLGVSDSFTLFDNKCLVAAQAIFQTDYDTLIGVGAEYWIYNMLALRAGYKFGAFNHPTFGAGLKYAGFEFDYAFMRYEDLGNTHRFSLLYRFGTPPVRLRASPKVFSPNNDNYLDTTTFTPVIKEIETAKSAVIKIFGADPKNPIVTIPLQNLTTPALEWNGLLQDLPLPDGVYAAYLHVNFENGLSQSDPVYIEIDNTPPVTVIEASPKLLRPGQNTALLIPANFNLSASDRNKISKWQLVIWDKDKKPFYMAGAQGAPPAGFTWDGTGINSQYVDTGEIYYYTLYANDMVGNAGRSKTEAVVILLKEIKLTFSSDALFDLGQADVKISAYNILKEMKTVINKYPESDIVVGGHTDSMQPIGGKYKDNKQLSKARADAVKFFMVNLLNIEETRIKTVGYGSDFPIDTNDTVEGRQKNRRVEIIIKSTIYK